TSRKHVGGFGLGDLRSRVRPAAEQSGNGARNKDDDEHNDTRRLHNASLSTLRCTRRSSHPAHDLGQGAHISAVKGQGMVNERYPNRVNGWSLDGYAVATRYGQSGGDTLHPERVRIDAERGGGERDPIRDAAILAMQALDPLLSGEKLRQR